MEIHLDIAPGAADVVGQADGLRVPARPQERPVRLQVRHEAAQELPITQLDPQVSERDRKTSKVILVFLVSQYSAV